MVNQQILQGNWNEIKGKIRSKWGQLTNDELQSFDGNVDRLVGMIQRKTGEARESVERFLDDATANGSSAAETVREYAHQAAEKVQQGSRQAAEKLRERSQQAAESLQEGYDALLEGYEEAEELVRRRPTESALVCFGAGIFAGLLLGLVLRRN